MTQPINPLSRRKFLQFSAAGVLTTTVLVACGSDDSSESSDTDATNPPTGDSTAATTAAGETASVADAYGGDFTWISPRGTIEVVDDYPYWVALAMGYFGDLPTAMEAGPSDATAVVRFTAVGQTDIGFPSPGVLTFAIGEDLDLVSVFGSGRLDLFNFAFRVGEGVSDIAEMEGMTVLLGSPGWQAICDPMFAAAGVDHTTINYVDAGFPGWTSTLASGEGDACLAWEGLRADLGGKGLEFDYWLGRVGSQLPSNSLVVRKADIEDEQRRQFIQQYLTAWAKGHEFAERNPRAATQIVFEALPAVRDNLGAKFGTESLMQIHQTFKGNDFESRAGWGEHDIPQWDLFFETAKAVGQTELDIETQDWVLNDFIEEANSFDKEAVWADADAFELDEDMAAVDVADIEANFFNNATNA